MTLPALDAAEYGRLRALSARVGADPLLVQAAGGNTSIKIGGNLWIKASGTWLQHAVERDIFVPVAMAPLIAAVEAGAPEAETAALFVPAELDTTGLRPSIETTVHALMPQRVVVHVHCVETIASAVEVGCEDRLAEPLAGLDWAFVPYCRPGLPLARAIAARRRPDTDVLVLGNHGIVVAADTVAAADAMLAEVRRRLARPARTAPPADLDRLLRLAGSRYRLPTDPGAHAVATDPVSLAIATGGTLYPDHAVFLGRVTPVAAPGEDADAVVARLAQDGLPAPAWILVPGAGVLLHREALTGVDPLARCAAEVAARIPEGTRLAWLGDADLDLIVNWDAEKYRQALARKAAASA